MSCFHPNVITYNPNGSVDSEGKIMRYKDGRVKTHFFLGSGYEVLDDDGNIGYKLNNFDGFIPQVDLSSVDQNGEISYSQLVPCQQCLGCRIDYSKKWADRIVMEQLMSPKNSCFFVTLTYNDVSIQDNLTNHRYDLVVDGDYTTIEAATLCKKDFQDFNKRLRKHFADHYDHQGIRFFMCGEYGSKYKRPHYHVCYFNLPIQDLQFYANNHQGDTLYTSPTLEKLWGKGYVVIGELNWESAAYTARYVVKKFKGKESEEYYHQMGDVLPEFCLSSRKPGLAASYFDKNMETIYRHDCIQLPSTRDRDGRSAVPRYFDKLLEKYLEDHPDCDINLEKVKADRRRAAEISTYNRRILSGLFDKEYFDLKEKEFKSHINLLKRGLD